MGEKAEYGNWVSKKIILLPGFLAFVFLSLGLAFWVLTIPGLLLRIFCMFGGNFLLKGETCKTKSGSWF